MSTTPTFTIRRDTGPIDEAAKAAGLTRSGWVNRAIDLALAYEANSTGDEAFTEAIHRMLEAPADPIAPPAMGSLTVKGIEALEGPATGGVVEGAGVVLVGEGETVCTVPARCPHRMTSVCEACARA